jgi:hypothetical protein
MSTAAFLRSSLIGQNVLVEARAPTHGQLDSMGKRGTITGLVFSVTGRDYTFVIKYADHSTGRLSATETGGMSQASAQLRARRILFDCNYILIVLAATQLLWNAMHARANA